MAAAPATSASSRLVSVVGWLLAIVAGAAVVARVATAASRLPASAIEPGLVDSAYATANGFAPVPVEGTLAVTNLQLRIYTAFTGSFGRHDAVLASARELSVAASVAIVLGLIVTAAVLRVRSLLVALVLAVLAISGPMLATLVPIGPGVLAAAWLALAAAAVAASTVGHDTRGLTACALLLAAAIATLPILVVPLGAVALAALGSLPPWARVAGAVAGLLGVAALSTLLANGYFRMPVGTGPLDRDEVLVLLAIVLAVAACAVVVGRAWPASVGVAVGIATGAVAAAVLGSSADALLPVLAIASAGVLMVLLNEIITVSALARVGVVLAATLVLAGCVAGVRAELRAGPPSSARFDHAGVASWVRTQVDPDVRLVAPVAVWADLDRDLQRSGLQSGLVRRAAPGAPPKSTELVVVIGTNRPPGTELATFGSGSQAVTVLATERRPDYLSPANRAHAGKQLAANPRLKATPQVRAALRAGRVDLRAMTILAGLCREHVIWVAGTSKPVAEQRSALPDRTLVVSQVDKTRQVDDRSAAALLSWLHAQRAPYAPADIQVTRLGVVLSWRIPARLNDVLS